jgi:DNA-binding CsgD family transcriptional regulator
LSHPPAPSASTDAATPLIAVRSRMCSPPGAGKVRVMEDPLVSYLHTQAAHTEPQNGLDVIHTAPAVFAKIKRVAAATRSEFLSLSPPRQPESAQEAREGEMLDRRLRHRGVRHLSVMSGPAPSPSDARVIEEWAAAGSPTRYSTSVPMRVLVFDGRVAFFALEAHDTRRGAYMTTASTLVQLACRLFDDVWQRALAMPGLATPARTDRTAEEQQQRVLDLLAEGYPDERIARDMGVSTRTIGRAVAQLQTELGAHSRFQLALLAQQAGLIARRPTRRRSEVGEPNEIAVR